MNWTHANARHFGYKYRNAQAPRGCQDYALSWVSEEGALAVVCDGAGSATKSHIASKETSLSISSFFEFS